MKILNCYRTYFPDPPGGLQEAIRQICLSTTNLGIQNTVFTLSPNPQPEIIDRPEAQVVREKSWFSPASCDLGSYSAISKFDTLSNQADLIHYYFPWPFLDVLDVFKTSDRPTVLTYISDIVRQQILGTLYTPLMWHTLKKMDVIVANCQSYVNTSPILSNPIIRDKVRVIPLGIDENSYPKEGDESIFINFHIKKDEPYFLFLGVLRYYKGIHTLIRAAKNLDAKIIIAGSGPEQETLVKQAADLQLKNIIFVGQVTNKEKISLIKNCTALVLPSHLRSEAYGMVLVEAAMMGKPMISCEIGTGTSFVNIHEATGLVITPENPDQLHDAMQTLLKDANMTRDMGVKARLRYEQHFSGPALGASYSELYKELA